MDHTPLTDEIEIIAPQAARAAIAVAISARLGENWRDEWLLVHDTDFLVRLNQGAINLDFQADLLGNVAVSEKEAHPLQVSGRFVALFILGASLFVALAIAVALNIIG
jgi:hypothetical protein